MSAKKKSQRSYEERTRLKRYLVKLQYDGSRFHGFQKQPSLPTVQGLLEASLAQIVGHDVEVRGAGRTDAGVHALGQRATFDVDIPLSPEKVMKSLNALIGPFASITEVAEVPPDFDPRREALSREYRYFVLNRLAPSAIISGFCFHFPKQVDLNLARSACEALVGEHYFRAFTTAKDAVDFTRMLIKCELRELAPNLLCLVVEAQSFLYKMVRIIAGAVLEVGTGRMALEELERNLCDGDSPCCAPLPPYGLFLWEISYPTNRICPG